MGDSINLPSDSTAAPGPTHGPLPGAAVDPSAGDEVAAARFEAAAARAGVDEAYTDVAFGLFKQSGQADPKAFVVELRRSKPALFGPQPGNTAPPATHGVPSAPPPGAAVTPFQTWQALNASGQRAEAEAYYRLNRHAINRTAR